MKHWLAVISLEHAKIASQSNFLQVCHGKKAPLQRTSAGDEFFIYVPKEGLNYGASLQQICFKGTFVDDRVYQVEQFPGFTPFRKDVIFDHTFSPISIKVIEGLELTANKNWGLILRRGFIELSCHDSELIMKSQRGLI